MITEKYLHVSPDQIHEYWEQVIKYAIVKVYRIPEDERNSILNMALGELLAGNYQCFFKCSDDLKNIDALEISAINLDKWTGQKSLELVCLYSFRLQQTADWQGLFDLIKRFARKEGCIDKEGKVIITTNSANPRAQEIAQSLGFTETYRHYTYIGD